MKKSLIGFVIFLLLAVSVSAAVNDPKLSFWTPLDEHDGLLTPELAHGLWVRLPQPPAFNVVPGVINNSFNFSGASNAYLLSLNSGDLDCTNALTLNLWAYFNNTGVHTISRRNPEALKKGYTLYFNSDKKVEFQIGDFTQVFKVVSPNALELDKWYHIVGTHNSTGGMKLYINGTLVNSTTVLQNIYPDYGVGVRLGISASGDTRFRGKMDDAAIYCKELNPTEVSKVYDIGIGAFDSPRYDVTIAASYPANVSFYDDYRKIQLSSGVNHDIVGPVLVKLDGTRLISRYTLNQSLDLTEADYQFGEVDFSGIVVNATVDDSNYKHMALKEFIFNNQTKFISICNERGHVYTDTTCDSSDYIFEFNLTDIQNNISTTQAGLTVNVTNYPDYIVVYGDLDEVYSQSTHADLGRNELYQVSDICNNNGNCDPGETPENCPADCDGVVPEFEALPVLVIIGIVVLLSLIVRKRKH